MQCNKHTFDQCKSGNWDFWGCCHHPTATAGILGQMLYVWVYMKLFKTIFLILYPRRGLLFIYSLNCYDPVDRFWVPVSWFYLSFCAWSFFHHMKFLILSKEFVFCISLNQLWSVTIFIWWTWNLLGCICLQGRDVYVLVCLTSSHNQNLEKHFIHWSCVTSSCVVL